MDLIISSMCDQHLVVKFPDFVLLSRYLDDTILHFALAVLFNYYPNSNYSTMESVAARQSVNRGGRINGKTLLGHKIIAL
jgi:hypothetical protein